MAKSRRRGAAKQPAHLSSSIDGGPAATLLSARELRSYEPGVAVQIVGSLHWLLVTGKIAEARICRVMDRSPIIAGWQTGREIVLDGRTLIGRSEAPARHGDADSSVVIDPVSNAEQDDGDLFRRHAWER